MNKLIPLTRGQFTIVDFRDFERLNQIKWQAQWSPCTKGYYATARGKKVNGKRALILMHRIITNAPDDMEVDHRDGNGLNNTRTNLRTCTHAQNARNRKITSGGSSSYKGVYWKKRQRKWVAQISINCKVIALGYYQTENEAALAYNEAAIKMHGEFAKLNEIKETDT